MADIDLLDIIFSFGVCRTEVGEGDGGSWIDHSRLRFFNNGLGIRPGLASRLDDIFLYMCLIA